MKAFTTSPAGFVRAGDNGRFGDGGVFDQGAFHLEGSDAVAGGQNHVVGSTDEPEIPILIHIGPVAREVPVALENRYRAIRLFPVFLEQSQRSVRFDPESDIALRVGRQDMAIIVDDTEIHPGRGLPHGAEPRLDAGKGPAEQDRFGLAVSIPDGAARGFFPDVHDLGVQRFTGCNTVAERLEKKIGSGPA